MISYLRRTMCLVFSLTGSGLLPTAASAASAPAVEARHGMVVSAQRYASEVGERVLAEGGNAIDAAVAVGYALSVVYPCCGNIGGGGFMLVHLADGRNTFINFRETAPHAATENMYRDASGKVRAGDPSLYGYEAVGVPGTVMGMERALREYGTLPRTQVMAGAIRLARDGYVLSRADTAIIDSQISHFGKDPVASKIFLKPNGSPYLPGDRFVQPQLAATLDLIAHRGPDAFYRGPIAQAIVKASVAHHGVLTMRDFADYTTTESAPVSCTYRGYKLYSAPPPSSGGTTMCEILNVLEGYDLRAMGFHSAASVHVMAEAMRHAYMDRNTYLGDPAFVHNPLDRLLSPSYAAAIRKQIETDKATPSSAVQPGVAPHEKPETTHYVVTDSRGNAVSVTYTINGNFGANVIAPNTGFFLNDEMDDFAIAPGTPNLFGLVQGRANAIAPGKRPLSSMSPTLVTRDGKVFLVLGSPGGSRIITITLQTFLNIVDYGMQPQAAVDAPRIHMQWLPDTIFYEPFALSSDTLTKLKEMGYNLVEQTPWGAAEVIQVGPLPNPPPPPASSGNDSSLFTGPRAGYFYGASDPRRPSGAAIGF